MVVTFWPWTLRQMRSVGSSFKETVVLPKKD
jgi:hypothetical protein